FPFPNPIKSTRSAGPSIVSANRVSRLFPKNEVRTLFGIETPGGNLGALPSGDNSTNKSVFVTFAEIVLNKIFMDHEMPKRPHQIQLKRSNNQSTETRAR
ncbi:MAG: hypothetical protein L7U83_13690, partial [Akkermansiaceae bacterium]|nr:hypothetical protein [Akkermansiaceae bacterium]